MARAQAAAHDLGPVSVWDGSAGGVSGAEQLSVAADGGRMTERAPLPGDGDLAPKVTPPAGDGERCATGPLMGYVKGRLRVIGRWTHEGYCRETDR